MRIGMRIENEMATTEMMKEEPIVKETQILDVKTVDNDILIESNMTFDIRINGQRLGSFRIFDGIVHMILHPDKFKGDIWIATDKKVKIKKTRGKTGCRWVDLI